ncbi:MAG: hypothetical protein ING16_12115 [Roseomonas sp.]|nr:hypothetical protein [Roseomonas sp.]
MVDDLGEDIFNFMSLRPIRRPQSRGAPHGAIRDDIHEDATVANGGGTVGGQRVDREIYSATGVSAVGFATFRAVAAKAGLSTTTRAVLQVLSAPPRVAPSLGPVVALLRVRPQDAARLSRLAGRPQAVTDTGVIVFPGSADDIAVPVAPSLSRLRAEVEGLLEALARPKPAEAQTGPLSSVPAPPAPVLSPLVERVFSISNGGQAPDFAASKRILFDALYGLTVLRRIHPADPSPAIAGLQTLHALERLAVFLFAVHVAQVQDDATEMARLKSLLATLRNGWPDLDLGTAPNGALKRLQAAAMPFAWEPGGPGALMRAQPVVQPIFARLNRAFSPFNPIRPAGIGDLMVVRQTFLGYRAGEIARVETVMAGESKVRTLRRLDRSEDVQGFTFAEDSETSTEIASAERFELKRETEQVLKTDVTAGLNASVSYTGTPVVSTVSVNASLAVGRSESDKVAESFARDVTEKALSRVQRRASQTRSRSLIAEAEDTAVHTLTAAAAPAHVNGFYRWIDKVYRAEVRNYGRRLMFELIVPEPAAFHVQSRLLAHVATLDLPEHPVRPPPVTPNTSPTAILGVSQAADITEAKWAELNALYFLDHLPPPVAAIEGVPILNKEGATSFTKFTSYFDGGFKTDWFWDCSVLDRPAGYTPSAIRVQGSAVFRGKNENVENWKNTLAIDIDSISLVAKTEEQFVNVGYDEHRPLPTGFTLNDRFKVDVRTKTCDRFNLTLSVDFQRDAATLAAWRTAVYAELVTSRLRKQENNKPVPDPEILAYFKALKDVKRASAREVLQGGSSAANRRRMEQELKRLAINEFTREFDVQPNDDQVTTINSMGEMPFRGGYHYPRLKLTPGSFDKTETGASFDSPDRPLTGYAAPDVGLSRAKAPHIQFLEHAFEWTNLSYVFYPYYWATPPKWVELLDREDDADPAFTEFLQAGAARMLIAVRPGFEDAVMHYLATREPWDGGAVPVIGDDLHLPVHEEIRELTEDQATTGIPVGESWIVTVPTSLIHLESNAHPLPNPWPRP